MKSGPWTSIRIAKQRRTNAHTPAGYTPCPLISGCDTQGKLRNDGSRNNHPHQRSGKKKRHYSKDITLLHKGVTS